MSRPPCSVEGCPKKARSRALCAMHYERWRIHGEPGPANAHRLPHRSVPCPVCAVPFLFTGNAQTCSRSCGQRYRRMLAGSARRLSSTGYMDVWAPDHPLARSDGYVAEHRMVAWDAGILTDPAAHVHHINHNKLDNRPQNLEALSPSEHHRRHIAEAGCVTNQYGVFPISSGECAVEGCAKPVSTRGWCNSHYIRWQRSGDPLGSTARRSA